MLLHELFAHRTHSIQIDGDGVQVQQWHAELIGSRNGDIARGGQVHRHQVADQAAALFLCLGDGVLHGVLIQQAVLHQSLGKTAQCHTTGAPNRRYCVVIHGLTLNPMPA